MGQHSQPIDLKVPETIGPSGEPYSLIQTAKARHLEPYQYLRHMFTELPKAHTVADIEARLPANIDTELVYR